MLNVVLSRIKPVLLSFYKFSDDVKVVYAYRYITLFVTSLFYIFCSNSSYTTKITVICCLTVSSIVLNKIYILCKNSQGMTLFVIFVEITGNVLLLIPTGGLQSPYIWYALNTVLISLYALRFIYCIMNLLCYIVLSITLSQLIDRNTNKTGVIEDLLYTIKVNTNFIIGMFLFTAIAGLLFVTLKKLDKEKVGLVKANCQLGIINNRLEKSVSCVMSLYQVVHSVANESDEKKNIELLTSYTRSILGSDVAFFCKLSETNNWCIDVDGECDEDIKKIIINIIVSKGIVGIESDETISFVVGNMKASCACIKSLDSMYGILGVLFKKYNSNIIDNENNEQLRFLTEVGAMFFDKAKYEKIYTGLLLNSEQNRIADEIHDSVCQRLFSVSCSIQSILLKNRNISMDELNKILSYVGTSLSVAIKDLREAIYGMSSKKFGVKMLEKDILDYLDDIKKHHNIQVILSIKGEQDFLSYDIKRVIYRIICEGVGNAVRHSQCSAIEIIIEIMNKSTKLIIKDNGRGFDVDNIVVNGNGGLGIKSMYNMVYFYNGQIKIETQKNKGTIMIIDIPNFKLQKEEVV